MREKFLLLLVLSLGLMLAFAHAQSPGRAEAQVGRYQIVTVAGNSNEVAQAFKIDTITGKIWGEVIDGRTKAVVFAILPDSPEP